MMYKMPITIDAETTQKANPIAALSEFLAPRIAQARRGEISLKSMADIRREARDEMGL